MNSPCKKEYRTVKPRRMTILIPTLLLIVLVAVIALNLYNVKTISNVYVVSVKIREGKVQADKIFEAIKMYGLTDEENMTTLYGTLSKHSPNLTGIQVEKDGKKVFYKGNRFPKEAFRNQNDQFMFFKSDTPVYFDVNDNNDLYRGFVRHFDMAYTIGPSKEKFLDLVNGSGFNTNQIRAYQDFWYEYSLGDFTIYCGQTIPITDFDYKLFSMTALELHFTGLIIVFVVLLIVSRVIESQSKLIRAYYADNETGGYNWYHFAEKVNKKLKKRKGKQKKENCALVQVKLVKFSNFVSCYGEEEGNKLLQEAYKRLKAALPKDGMIARYDKADFALYFTYSTPEKLLERVASELEMLKEIRPQTSLSFKAGIYMFEDDDTSDAFEAYTRATLAEQKAEGTFDKDVMFFNSNMKYDIQWEKKMENDLNKGLKNDEFLIYLQPKYSCDNEEMVSAEALVRWNHPLEGFLTPYKFIDIFERTGQIIKLDDYMISHVAKIQAELIKAGITPVPISVNISRIHFIYTDLAEHICEIVDRYKVPHNLIEIELTESAFLEDKEGIINTAGRLRQYGFEVSLDDFGSGYSSLNTLRTIPLDTVKIDGGFFKGNDIDGSGAVIVSQVINLAKQLGKKLVAEGIEDRKQVDFLKEAGCDMIQGFYFAKPMPFDEFRTKYYK